MIFSVRNYYPIIAFEIGGHWPLWRGWKYRMITQNRQKSNANFFWKLSHILWLNASSHGLINLVIATNFNSFLYPNNNARLHVDVELLLVRLVVTGCNLTCESFNTGRWNTDHSALCINRPHLQTIQAKC